MLTSERDRGIDIVEPARVEEVVGIEWRFGTNRPLGWLDVSVPLSRARKPFWFSLVVPVDVSDRGSLVRHPWSVTASTGAGI
jgi:hypothetical protein